MSAKAVGGQELIPESTAVHRAVADKIGKAVKV